MRDIQVIYKEKKKSNLYPCLPGLEFTGSNYPGNFPQTFLPVSDTQQTTVQLHWKMASVNSSKSHRFVDFLPSIRPSFLSVVLLFACGCLWVKNETTNKRLTALETRINISPVVLVDTGYTTENSEKTTRRPKEDSTRYLFKKIQRDRKFSDTSG